MPQYRKKPVVINAILYHPEMLDIELRAFTSPTQTYRDGENLVIETLEGNMTASPGDWLIRGVKNELYPSKPDIFDATYEEV